jgi:TolA-binding protein
MMGLHPQTTSRPSDPMKKRSLFSLIPALLLSGCATKYDIRGIEDALADVRAEQHAAEARRRGAEQALRADLEGRLTDIEGIVRAGQASTTAKLAQVEALTGVAQQRVTEVESQLRARLEAQLPASTGVATDSLISVSTPAAACPPKADAGPILDASAELLRRRTPATATVREAATEYLRCFAGEAGAPRARLLLAESYALEGKTDQALGEFHAVATRHPRSTQAPTALYRMGAIEADRRGTSEARQHWQTLIRDYPNAPETRLAREALPRL